MNQSFSSSSSSQPKNKAVKRVSKISVPKIISMAISPIMMKNKISKNKKKEDILFALHLINRRFSDNSRLVIFCNHGRIYIDSTILSPGNGVMLHVISHGNETRCTKHTSHKSFPIVIFVTWHS